MDTQQPSLKLRTARTLKWNTIDRISSQVLYAATGIVLANVLTQEDFGLAGALLVFQAFAILFVDSGFGAALLQKKEPTQTDYSTVFWFNALVCAVVYGALWAGAPLIADIFHDTRLVELSRAMFVTFILNGLAIVQTNRLMKRMEVRMIAVANLVSLTISGALGIWLALSGFGAWALVWQYVSQAGIKTLWLWATGGWLPSAVFSRHALRGILPVGSSVFSSSFLNTLCLHIYSFVIGAFYNLRALGVYTQADKWSKMGSASLSQILTASFVPLLARVQDDPATHRRYIGRINRFTALILFPAMTGLAAVGAPLFHTLFGHKWDAAIILFRILCVRGIFVVLVSAANNYLLSLGKSRAMILLETVKDVLTLAAIAATVWMRSVEALVWGQFAASLLTYAVALPAASRATGYTAAATLRDFAPFAFFSALMAAACLISGALAATPWVRLAVETAVGALTYIALLRMARVPEYSEALTYLPGRFRRKPKANDR